MQYAEMTQKQFTAEKQFGKFHEDTQIVTQGSETTINKFVEKVKNPTYKPLKIPRRPEWNKDMSREEIDQNEKTAFLEWRRDLAQVEENNIKLAITPFEKNIEVWRQLWRVIEKSDLLLQIVDARNPYFFYSEDLETYIKESGGSKQFILCINKADYLSEELIQHWNQYFNEKNIKHVFISAKKEQDKLDQFDDNEYGSSDEEEEKK